MPDRFILPALLAISAASMQVAVVEASSSTASKWTLLRFGMTADETLATLGAPLLRTSGNGFELWTYDRQAEVVFYGDLVGWTSPATNTENPKPVDVWQAKSIDPYALIWRLPPPGRRPKDKEKESASRSASGQWFRFD